MCYIRVFPNCWNNSWRQGFVENRCKRLRKLKSKFLHKVVKNVQAPSFCETFVEWEKNIIEHLMLQYRKNASVLRTLLNCMAVQSFSLFCRDIDKYNCNKKAEKNEKVDSQIQMWIVYLFTASVTQCAPILAVVVSQTTITQSWAYQCLVYLKWNKILCNSDLLYILV